MASATAVVVRCCHTIAMATSMAIAMAQAKGTAAIALAMAMAVAMGTATAMDMPMAMDGHRYGHGTNVQMFPYFRCDTNFGDPKHAKHRIDENPVSGIKNIKNQLRKYTKT